MLRGVTPRPSASVAAVIHSPSRTSRPRRRSCLTLVTVSSAHRCGVLLPVNHAPESRGGSAPGPRYREDATELWHTSHKEKDMAGERPVGVTIVAVIAWIIGAIQ